MQYKTIIIGDKMVTLYNMTGTDMWIVSAWQRDTTHNSEDRTGEKDGKQNNSHKR